MQLSLQLTPPECLTRAPGASRCARSSVRIDHGEPAGPVRAVGWLQAGHGTGPTTRARAWSRSPSTLACALDPEVTRDRRPVKAGLGVSPLAHAQGLLEQRVEHGSQVRVALAGAQRLPQLSQDLALTERHRLQPTGQGEQVVDGPLLVVHIEVGCQVLQVDARLGGQGSADWATAPWKVRASAYTSVRLQVSGRASR